MIFLSKKIPQNVILGPNSVPWLSASISQHYPMPQIHLFTDSLWWLFHILFPMPKPPAWHPSSFLAEAFKYCFIEKAEATRRETCHPLIIRQPSPRHPAQPVSVSTFSACLPTIEDKLSVLPPEASLPLPSPAQHHRPCRGHFCLLSLTCCSQPQWPPHSWITAIYLWICYIISFHCLPSSLTHCKELNSYLDRNARRTAHGRSVLIMRKGFPLCPTPPCILLSEPWWPSLIFLLWKLPHSPFIS